MPPPVTEAPTTSAAPTTITTVAGPPRATTTIPLDISPGDARITGTVVGPQGPVPGATVRLERLVGPEPATVEANAPSGSFTFASIRGGRYRISAWRAPDLLQTQPDAFFLAADETKTIDLRVTTIGDLNAQATVEPNPPPADEPFSITVFVFAGSVSDQGVLQASPRPGQEVQIALGPSLGLASADRAVTDGGGRATFRARCRASGPAAADLVVVTARLPLALPACR